MSEEKAAVEDTKGVEGSSKAQAVDMPYRDVVEASHIYILPNLFTAGNLFFGFIAIIWCIHGRYVDATQAEAARSYTEAVFFILAAGLCDVFDGRVARLGGRESLFGKEFDSIADVVSFGVAPALMVFFLLLSPTMGYDFYRQIGWLVGFIYLLCAGVRLARFNVITNPFIPGSNEIVKPQEFLGLPAPAAAGLTASLVLLVVNFDLRGFALFLPPLMLLTAWLMVSKVPYPSFKYLSWNSRMGIEKFILLIVVVAAFITFWRWSFAVAFILYIFYGFFRDLRKTYRRKRKLAAQEN
ncbi:CDP-diacylglycerol--serine O-phosphatidyltransferase [Rubellicoccus peritrichatus]|uniref:CDP-diacylglycerol--serine O-phosphatidyltransferase n=1 Tax=Rubellicoccus peritrichatus TaxID=3080537 RepID=A0AAQ3QXN9_9BACT|nr:CDP-diacylglycerol--serine O-phosphatidyltransferase [Puniceicoccus sp. CR14]WOO43232.1 CDP-diacylglycerol--serine O-phosphatidyltransferase [Puniceicoccus sp. CR14]